MTTRKLRCNRDAIDEVWAEDMAAFSTVVSSELPCAKQTRQFAATARLGQADTRSAVASLLGAQTRGRTILFTLDAKPGSTSRSAALQQR